MSLVFQNIDPSPHSPLGECVPPAFIGGRGHTRRAERGVGGSIFWKTRDIGLPSYSNNLSKTYILHLSDGVDTESIDLSYVYLFFWLKSIKNEAKY